jgi:Major Facilitator Superfamily
MDAAGTRSSVDDIVARLERLPTSWWQVKARIIVGVATFFDAFDALAIASVLPVIVPLWKLTPPQIGLMISAGFLGQLLGALLFGWIAERYGRMTAMVWSIALFAVVSLACAFAWDGFVHRIEPHLTEIGEACEKLLPLIRREICDGRRPIILQAGAHTVLLDRDLLDHAGCSSPLLSLPYSR